MKILCDTQVVNRQNPNQKAVRAVKATLALGMNVKARDSKGETSKQVEIIHFTPQNKVGKRYKVIKNIEKIFTKFVQDGKATISFLQPPDNLMIKCDPLQLKAFLQALKLGMEGKDSINLRLNIAAATAIPKKCHPVTNLVITKPSEYPTKGFPKTLTTLSIQSVKLCKVSFDILSLRNLTSLDLSNNKITKLPPDLGRLSLKELHLSNNQLGDLNQWKWLLGNNIQQSLKELCISNNNIKFFPREILKMENLVNLKLNHNEIKSLPFGFRRMRNLRFLHFAENQLVSLPSDFNHMRLEVLDVWSNDFQPQRRNSVTEPELPKTITDPTPLWILAARSVNQHKLPYTSATIPWILVDFISEASQCACGKICYSSAVVPCATLATFQNVKNLVFSRDRLIYCDIVLCGAKCYGNRQMMDIE